MQRSKKGEPGKVVGGARYVHISDIDSLPKEDKSKITLAARLIKEGKWNVVKIPRASSKVSLLYYAEFFRDPFPPLNISWSIDLQTHAIKKTSYYESKNPPILHRKELLLPFDHPERSIFACLTEEIERLGLYGDSKNIGRRSEWEARLRCAGVKVKDHRVVFQKKDNGIGSDTSTGTARHRTSIRRDDLSRPLKLLAGHGYLGGQYSVFDYGCGRGDDLRLLNANGVTASGWDPYYRPDDSKVDADIVNLGYVINVIESAEERRAVLRDAWGLAKTCLVVAVMLRGQGGTGTARDVEERVSSRNTYQKYFTQADLREWVAAELGEQPLALGPGVVVVHRDKIAEQRLLLERYRRPVGDVVFSPRAAVASAEHRDAFFQTHEAALKPLWKAAVQRGRTPTRGELSDELVEKVEQLFRSVDRAVDWVVSYFGPDEINEGASRRREDLLVTFALETFSGRRRYREWPPELQADVRAFWKSYKKAVEESNQLLFSLGDPATVEEACRAAFEQGLGYLEPGKSLQIHTSGLSKLPSPLRIYVGCAEQLYGDIAEADLVKIHIRSGKLTLLFHDDFGKRIPMLRYRVKVSMRQQDIEFFEYGGEYPEQPLWQKSRYMVSDMPGYDEQKTFDDRLADVTGLDFSGFGPSWEMVVMRLREVGSDLDLDGA